jgi:tetratricopeptide (TPR) repeat protein
MRCSVALLLLLPACTTLDSEQATRLAEHQRYASYYYEKQKWSQAMDQIERGLELEPEDYKLQSMKGQILLLFSGDAQGTDHKKLDEATDLLARVFDTRSVSRHEPHLLLNYACALQKQGLRHLGEAVRLEGAATRAANPDEGAAARTKAADEREEANTKLAQADELFVVLIERGWVVRLAHSHRLQIALQRGDDQTFRDEAKAYFEQVAKDEKATATTVQATKSGMHEQEQIAMLNQLRDEELQVRNVVAQFHYDRKEFKDALAQLNRVLEIDPRRFTDYFNRGRVLLELGKTEEAKSDFRRFLADPTIPTTSEKAVFALKVIDR